MLGVRWEQALEGFRTQMPQRFETADEDIWVNAVVVEVNERGLADSIEPVLMPVEEPRASPAPSSASREILRELELALGVRLGLGVESSASTAKSSS